MNIFSGPLTPPRNRPCFLALLFALMAVALPLQAQSPATIGGRTFVGTVTSGTSPFATFGSFRFIPSALDTSYAIVPISGNTEADTGTHTYTKTGSTTANLSFLNADSIAFTISANFNTANSGSYVLTSSSIGGSQTGTFSMHSGTSPAANAFSAVPYRVSITSGEEPFADSGSYVFSPTVNGTYTTTGSPEVGDSFGTYTYTKNSETTGYISYDDSEVGPGITFQLSFDTATSGTVFLRKQGSSAYQTGTFTRVAGLAITTEPRSQSVALGGSATLSVSATGIGTLRYQWFQDCVALSGETGNTLTRGNATAAHNGYYYVEVSDDDSFIPSARVQLSVLPAVGTPFTGSDSFNASSSPTRWASKSLSAGCDSALVETGGRLEFRDSTDNTRTRLTGERAWLWNGLAPYGQDWEARVAVNVPNLSFTSGSEANVGLGLWVVNSADPGDVISVELEAGQGSQGSGSFRHFIAYEYADDHDLPLRDVKSATTSTTATLRVRWVAATALLHLEYDADGPANGDSWTTLRTFNPSGANGWGMSSSGSFLVETVGHSFERNIASEDGVFLDDFSASIAGASGPVTTAPLITTQPASQTVNPGQSVVFSVTATGTAPLGYQWNKNGTAINGATSSSYTVASPQVSDAASYTVLISNTAGSVTSSAATLTVNGVPVVTSAATATALVGQAFSYQITASRSPTGFNATGLPAGLSVNTGTGLISGTPTIVGTSTVTLSASNADGTGTGVLTLTVALPPSITSQPQGQTVSPGQSAAFSVTVTGTAPFSYQWRKNGGNLSGAINATLTLNSVQAADAGDYSVVVSNGAGSVTSAVAALAVNGPVALLTQPQAQALNRGAVLTLAVTASGTQPITYQWRLNGANLPNATSATYTVASVQLSDAGNYDVVLNNIVGSSVTSTVVPVTVVVAADILTQPVSQTVLPGSSVTFLVVAEGSGTLSYQWTKNGQNVSGATTATLALSNVTTNDQGAYRVTVRNDRGSVTSTPAFLTVVQRQVKVGEVQTTNLMAGSALRVPITLTGDGSEHAVSVSVAYDPNLLTLSGVSSSVSGGMLVVTNITSNSVVGVSVTLPAGQSFSAGSNALVELEFTVATVTRQMVGSLLLPEAPLPNLVTDTNDVPLVSEFAAGSVVFKTPVPQTVGVSTGLKGETFSFAVPPGATRAMFVRVLIYDLGVDSLGNAIRVFNAAGTNAAGIPFILLPRALTAGQQLDLALEYYVSDRTTVPTPRFVTELINGGLTTPTGPRVEPERARMFAGKFHVDFRTSAGKRYFIEYAPSPAGQWETSFPPVVGSGSAMQWTDTGPPRTSSLPTGQRFYRLILAD